MSSLLSESTMTKKLRPIVDYFHIAAQHTGVIFTHHIKATIQTYSPTLDISLTLV